MTSPLILKLHLFAVAFWWGVVAVEFLLEQSRATSRQQGFAVARLHRQIDLCFEMPAFMTVLVTGLLLFQSSQFHGLYAIKVVAGLLAIGGNMLCLIPVLRRQTLASADNLGGVIQQSAAIDKISLAAIPAGLVALICGIILMSQRV